MANRTRRLVWLAAAGLLSLGTTNQPPMYCVEKTSVPRTQLPKAPRQKDIPKPPGRDVAEVRIQELAGGAEGARSITDPETLRAIADSYAMSAEDWAESRSERVPLYRIDVVARDGARSTYWLGANSHPARFPCYAFCSGWWLAPSDDAGALDATRYKGLPDSVEHYFLRDLDIP